MKTNDTEKTNNTKRTIHGHEIMELSGRDRKVFVSAILKPPAPGKRLKKAAKRYKNMIKV